MKKIFVSIAAIAVLTGLVSCKKNDLTQPSSKEGSSFSLTAEIDEIEKTKTTINGLEVNWEAGDILYLVTSDGTWGKAYADDKPGETIADYTFSGSDFTSEATINEGTYTFYALYGDASQRSYHRSASTTYFLKETQNQDCTNPTAHLKVNDALVGAFEATVPSLAPASVTMQHLFAIMRVDVKNQTGSDLVLKKFEMTAADATLAGLFTVNFGNTPIDIAEKSSQSSTITVNLTNGNVAAGASLPVYFVMAPLTNYSGNVTLTVTDSNEQIYTKTVTLSGISFAKGSLNTTPYTITAGTAPTSFTWDLSTDSTSEASADRIGWTNDVADMLCEKGTSSTDANNYYPGSGKTSTRFYGGSKLSITPKAGQSLTYYVFTATTEGYASTLANSTWTNADVETEGTIVTVVATDPTLAVSASITATCGFTKVECHTDAAPVFPPAISTTQTNVSASASGETCKISYTIKHPVDGKAITASVDQTWVNGFDYSTAGEVSFNVDANTGDSRTATITLSYEGAADVTVTVSQGAVSGGAETTFDLSGTFSFANSELSLTQNGITVVQKNVSGSTDVNSNYKTASTLRLYKGHALVFSGKTITKLEITVNTTYYGNSLTADTGTLTPTTTKGGTIVWEGSADTVTITNVATTNNVQLRPAKITITYTE